jgi:hypothetical protein
MGQDLLGSKFHFSACFQNPFDGSFFSLFLSNGVEERESGTYLQTKTPAESSNPKKFGTWNLAGVLHGA